MRCFVHLFEKTEVIKIEKTIIKTSNISAKLFVKKDNLIFLNAMIIFMNNWKGKLDIFLLNGMMISYDINP